MTKNELAEKREKAVYHFRNYDSVCCIFDTVLIQLNQVEREGLYETEGKTFEKAKVVEIKKIIQQSREIRLEINWFPFDY